jgi:hypothetical protein
MTLSKLLPLTIWLLLGCTSQPSQRQKPTPVTTSSAPSDAQAIDMERQREKQMPCSAEWLKTATAVQKKNCLQQSSINQAMNALSTVQHPQKGTTAGASDNKQ